MYSFTNSPLQAPRTSLLAEGHWRCWCGICAKIHRKKLDPAGLHKPLSAGGLVSNFLNQVKAPPRKSVLAWGGNGQQQRRGLHAPACFFAFWVQGLQCPEAPYRRGQDSPSLRCPSPRPRASGRLRGKLAGPSRQKGLFGGPVGLPQRGLRSFSKP